ncbi:MAG: alanine racemase [Armatimonadia bacterium]
MRSAWLEIDLSALSHNLKEIRKIVGPQTGIIAISKCNAYGHGAVAVARHALANGCCMAAVALIQEGLELREAGIDAPVLVLGAADPEEAPLYVEHGIHAAVGNLEFARALSAAAAKAGRPGLCHLKIDSGMGRHGVRREDVETFGAALRELPGLAINGVFSHFACSTADCDYTNGQREIFVEAVPKLEKVLGFRIPMHHLANSGGILRHPDSHLDAVRPGALLFGIASRGSGEYYPGARQVMSLKARVVFTKHIHKGESVGYFRTYVSPEDTTTAIVPLGYGDGYPRALSNKAEVLIHGQRCPVVGRISMDCLVVSTGCLGDVQVGDEVVLMGRQGQDVITAGELAEHADTIVQEICSRMSTRLPRVYLESTDQGN